jgi:hypothetical protein
MFDQKLANFLELGQFHVTEHAKSRPVSSRRNSTGNLECFAVRDVSKV